MRVGFSGTREGMTAAQTVAVATALRGLGATHLHHGDCEGSDEAAHAIARDLRIAVELHPPNVPALRAFCGMRPSEVEHDEAPYLVRNAAIAAATEVLIACPRAEVGEETRSGTWWTVRAARRLGRPVAVVRPSGRVERERWPW